MAVNRYYKREPYELGLYTPPIGYVEKTLQFAQKQYDTNYSVAEMIKNHYIESLPQDRAQANAIQEEYEKRIDDIVATYKGDYSQAGKDLRGLLSDIKKDYNPGGRAAAISSNYATYKDWLGRHQERLKKGEILAEDLNLANDYFMSNYTGVGNIDPVTGDYNRFNPEEVSAYTDPDKIIQDVYKTFKPEKRKVGKTVFENGLKKYTVEETEGIDANRLLPSFRQALLGNPQYSNYLAQKSKFLGLDSDSVEQYIDQYSEQRAQDLSYMNVSHDEKFDRDPLYLLREKARLDKKNQDDLLQKLSYRYDPATKNINRDAVKIDPENWRKSINSGNTKGPNAASFSGTAAAGFTALMPGYAQYNPTKDYPNTFSKSLPEFLSNTSELKKYNVDPILAQQVFQDFASEYGKDFQQQYDNSPGFAEDFDRQFWKQYKRAHETTSAGQATTIPIPRDAGLELAETIASRLSVNSESVYRPGETVASAPSAFGLNDANKLFDSKTGKLKPGIIATDYVTVQQGYPFMGIKLNVPDVGEIVVVDQETHRQEISQNLQTGFNPIFVDGQKTGGVMRVQGGFPVIPEMVYSRDNKTGDYSGTLIFNIADPKHPDYGKPATVEDDASGEIRLYNMHDVIDGVAPELKSALPQTRTKNFYNYPFQTAN